jgi:hypothetical protein
MCMPCAWPNIVDSRSLVQYSARRPATLNEVFLGSPQSLPMMIPQIRPLPFLSASFQINCSQIIRLYRPNLIKFSISVYTQYN